LTGRHKGAGTRLPRAVNNRALDSIDPVFSLVCVCSTIATALNTFLTSTNKVAVA
jgi:hypothetical protein